MLKRVRESQTRYPPRSDFTRLPMTEIQQQLAALRARMARVMEDCAEKYERPRAPRPSEKPYFQDEDDRFAKLVPLPPGQEVVTSHGQHYEMETLYPSHRNHGNADVGALSELAPDLLRVLSNGTIANVPPSEWAFLDTETTGLSSGTGTCAFLIGVGWITAEGFRVRQFFMRDYGEECSSLAALSQFLEPFRVLITYNGRTFDQPLLETRYRMNRARPPFAALEHLDLLHGARRLWKLRFESCRLVELEQRILGYERTGDVPGWLIPNLFFEFLRTGSLRPLAPVFYHNATDILSLACLTSVVPYAFNDPAGAPLRHGAELAGIARWLEQEGQNDTARTLYRRAIDAGLPDDLMFRTLWTLGQLERKMKCLDGALEIWNDLAGSRNPFRAQALEELAKHHEHRAKDYSRALELTRQALALGESEALRKREQRLAKRVG